MLASGAPSATTTTTTTESTSHQSNHPSLYASRSEPSSSSSSSRNSHNDDTRVEKPLTQAKPPLMHHHKGYASLPLLSTLRAISPLSGVVTPPEDKDLPILAIANDSEYTTTKPTQTSTPKLYSPGSSSLSTKFMHKGRRGFPVRSDVDDYSAALMFGHSKNSQTSTSSSSVSSTNDDGDDETPTPSTPSSPTQELLEPSQSDDAMAIIRKKSGERVKSSLKLPSLVRAKSLPSAVKFVHFDAKLEQVRRFSKSDEPTAVSAGNSPSEERVSFHWADDRDGDDDGHSDSSSSSDDEYDLKIGYYNYMNTTSWQINLPNFSKPSPEKQQENIYLEHMFLSTDRTKLIGHVAVKNMCYHKKVTVRYTVDYWKTVTEVCATFNDDVRKKQRQSGYDRFTFVISLDDLPQRQLSTKSMFFCIRYNANDQEFWDNNNSFNYQVDFNRVRKDDSTTTTAPSSAFDTKSQASSLPSQRSSAKSSSFGAAKRNGHARTRSEDLDARKKEAAKLAGQSSSPSSSQSSKPRSSKNHLGQRYSFATSSVDSVKSASSSSSTNSSSSSSNPLAKSVSSLSRPAWDSRSYQDLLNNYCFFHEKPASKPINKTALSSKTTSPSTILTSMTNDSTSSAFGSDAFITSTAGSVHSHPPQSPHLSQHPGVFVNIL